jgi:UDP-2-acetamido-2-deoxy-ribo-hexuluronate aminotransferase
MDTLQCAIVLAKLERFEWEIERRLEVGKRYIELLQGAGLPVRPITVRADRQSVWGQFTVMIKNRDKVADLLQSAGIPTAVHYPTPIPLQPAYAHLCCPDCCPKSLSAAATVASLPMSPDLSEEDIQRVVKALVKSVRELEF